MAAGDIRLGASSAAHAPLLARLVHASGPEYFDFLYGADGSSVAMLEKLCAYGDGYFGTTHTTAAYGADGALLGIEHGFDKATQTASAAATAAHLRALVSRDELRRIAWADGIQAAFIKPIPDGAYYVQNLSVVSEARGRGIGQRLLENAFAREAAAGCDSVHLDVTVTNPAVRFYERLGMEIAEELRHAEYEREYGLKGQYRMIKRLR